MSATGEEQRHIQGQIDSATNDELVQMSQNAEITMHNISILIGQKKLSKEEHKASSLAIEMLTRLDSTRLGKGAFYRAKHRINLVLKYLR